MDKLKIMLKIISSHYLRFVIGMLSVGVLFQTQISCRGDRDILPEEERFLKEVNVDGVRDVHLDLTSRTIEIRLDESFQGDFLTIRPMLYSDGAIKIWPWDDSIDSEKIVFNFRGSRPKQFDILKKTKNNGEVTRSYIIYVAQEGKLTAVLSSPMQLYPIGYGEESSDFVHASIRFTAGLGTIPSVPGVEEKVVPTLVGDSGNFSVVGLHDVTGAYLSFEKAAPLLTSSQVSLKLVYGEKRYEINGKKVVRAPIRATLSTEYKLFEPILPRQDVRIEGGYFLKDLLYKVKIENDFIENPIWIKPAFKTPTELQFTTPEYIVDGNYLISVFEGDSIISAQSYNVIRDTSKVGIGHIWTNEQSCPSQFALLENTSRTKLNKGQSFFVRPFPPATHGQHTPIDYGKSLPALELRAHAFTVVLPAQTMAESCYADNSIIIYYGKYTIPDSISPGLYEARLIYPNGKRSLVYWSQLLVR